MTLRMLFGKYDRKLRKYCKEQIKRGETDSSALWMCDNYHTCSASLKAAKGYLSRKSEKELLPLFLSCRELASSDSEITESRIIKKFSGKKLTVIECDALKIFMAAAFAVCAYEKAVEEKDTSGCIKNLIRLRNINFPDVFFYVSGIEKYLYDDPSGMYEKCNEKTKQLYRKAVRKGAKKEKTDEISFIKKKLIDAKNGKNNHIGFYLDVIPDKKKQGTAVIITEWLTAAVLSFLFSFVFTDNYFVFPLSIFLFYALIRPVSDMLCSKLFPPFELLSLDEENIKSADTLIAVSCVMPSPDETDKLFVHLSDLYSANSADNVKVMLLADLKSSSVPEDPSDKSGIRALKRLIDSLNEKHGGGFLVAVRDRVYSPTENLYTGYERKRGAIITLARYLKDKNDNGFSVVYGDSKGLGKTEYILALDSDTRICFEAVSKLVAAARHPLNIPVIDEVQSRVVSGYGIINPLTETSVESSDKTVFSGIFTSGGTSSYAGAVNERYSDMFSEGIFTGKGLINVDAFVKTISDKFDNDRILSHDILEGNVMRTAFYSECRFADSFPGAARSFFARQHRWIRGDVQNLRYMVTALGKKSDSPEMSVLGKYQLFDNFRRAFTPVIAAAFFILSAFCDGYYDMLYFMALSVLSAAASEITAIIVSMIKDGPDVLRTLYFSADAACVYKNFLRMSVNIASIPENAYVCADAIIRALYRWLVSKKKLLQWTEASAAEKSRKKNIVQSVAFPFLYALAVCFFGISVHRFFAVAFLLFIPFSLSDGVKKTGRFEKPLSGNEKRILDSFAAAAWNFFEENMSSLENWLPPDNIQETPVPKKAKRTSPTNIGLYLVSCLAAADLFLITADEMFRRIDNTLGTIEKMPKYKGLLYNWYDTVRLTPLRPSYVSTVDCGNYLVCLTALKEGLKEYAKIDGRFFNLAERIERILESSDLTILYDKNRKLFRIGIDSESGKLSESFYDLYMSEARMTSYYECARRHVSSEHWAALGRTLKRSGAYVGVSSWTGTLFEYFMPVLFMPVVYGTFQYEALKVCLYMQKKYAAKKGIPYGISESCFFSLDPSMNYRYKAHGLRSLSLKRETDEEDVISPYSVFLTLPFDRKSAMKNLSELSALHMEGRCGFYEAADFTKSRTEGEDYAVVRAYMSHHVGMSIIAICNVLKDNIFVKRFMSDGHMNSAKILLEEKLPVHPPVLQGLDYPVIKKSDKKYSVSRNVNISDNNTAAYSNGELTLLCDKYGNNRLIFAGSEIYKYSDISRGISVGYREAEDENITALFPLYRENIVLKPYGMKAVRNNNELKVTSALMVHPSGNSLLVPVKAENESNEEKKVKIFFFFEPYLMKTYDKNRHPAYSDMFTAAYRDNKNRACFFWRTNDDSSPVIAAGFCNKENAVFCSDREKVISRRKDAAGVFGMNYNEDVDGIRGINPVCAVSTEIILKAGESRECVFVISTGIGRENALNNLYAVRKNMLPSLSSGAAAPFMRDGTVYNFACNFLSAVFFDGTLPEAVDSARNSLSSSVKALWKCGISGDIPVFTVFLDEYCPEELLRSFVRFHKRLAKCSLLCDAVFVLKGSRDYGDTCSAHLMNVIKEEGRQDCIGLHGGIHIIYRNDIDKDSFDAIVAFSGAVYPDNGFVSEPEKQFVPVLTQTKRASVIENGFYEGGYLINSHPLIPWSHTLANSTFGTLLTDRSLGFTWAKNASLNRLTPWSNNTAADLNGERLFLKKDDRIYDLTDNATVMFKDNEAMYGCFADDIFVTVRVFVPGKGMKKFIEVSLENTGNINYEIQMFYCVHPVMGENNTDGKFVKIRKGNNTVIMTNPLNDDFKGVFVAGSFGENSTGCDNMKEFFAEDKKCAGILQKFVIDKKQKKKILFFLQFTDNLLSAEKLLTGVFPLPEKEYVSFNTDYPMFNELADSLLYHQVKDTRINARCGFYQNSGAFGYRDQLQDALALIGRDNRKVRQLIYRACSAQFYEGDVLHWFHTIYRKGLIYKGVRTRCSDDMLWLVYAVARYVSATGDIDILNKKIPFVTGDVLSENQSEAYGEYRLSKKKESVFFHCLGALNRSFTKGAHSLPLMGNGDWNDSFSEVGINGQGESVWLAMFIRLVNLEFAKICEIINKPELADYLKGVASDYTDAVEKYAWNGKWYLRGFFDDGTPLGEEGNDSCEIDILTQSFSVLSGMPSEERRKLALKQAYDRLFDEENGIIRLFSPPFNKSSKRAGYVNDYPEGMRENGGQYTHAAVWFATALFREGMREEGRKVLEALLPNLKYEQGKGAIYKTEPYALCGDVYSAAGHEGRGGWSLYTGSAGWLLQLADELNK